MQFNPDTFQETIDELWEENMNKMCDNIISYSTDFCPVPPNVESALLIAAKESYLAALKTIEHAVIASFK